MVQFRLLARIDYRGRYGGQRFRSDGLSSLLVAVCGRAFQLQGLPQVVEESLLRVFQNAVGVADANCHLVGERSGGRALQLCGGLRQGELSPEDILVSGGQVEVLAGKSIYDSFNPGALCLILRAVGERCQDTNANDCPLFLLRHGLWFD